MSDHATTPIVNSGTKLVDTNALTNTIDKLYHLNMNHRNESKFVVRFTNSIRGQLRWYTHELGDGADHIRKSPKSDALWTIVSRHITHLCGPKHMTDPVSCPEGIQPQLWFHIEKRVVSLVFYMRGRSDTEKAMVALAKTLPFADWVQSTECPGFSLLSYAKLIGTARNLASYHSPSALWKMLGMAPITKDGITKAGSTWMYDGGLSAEDWKSGSYSPTRRSMVYVFGDCLLKAGGGLDKPEKWSRYSKIYYDRKALEQTKAPLLKPIIHHRRAQRVMEKRLLRDLWVMWRDLLRPQEGGRHRSM